MSILKKIKTAALALLALLPVGLTSCESVWEDLDPCPEGVRLRFVYDYNMEYANAFPSQVDCLTVLVYDKEGKYVKTMTAARPETSDEDWRMEIELPAGDYKLLAYGGMDCENASFKFASDPSETLLKDLKVYLPDNLITTDVGTDLHPLFYGRLDLTIPSTSTKYVEKTVYMMKDTNDIRILLANANGQPTNAKDFIFTITDDNTWFNYLNYVIPTKNVTYYPWTKGNADAGLLPGGEPTNVTFAEFSVSRLMDKSKACLRITRASDGKEVVKISLIKVLELLKSSHFDKMDNQEFLDRESRWKMAFILTGDDVWAGVSIIINDWVVRINNINDLGL